MHGKVVDGMNGMLGFVHADDRLLLSLVDMAAVFEFYILFGIARNPITVIASSWPCRV